ncbi:MAG: hypothetical protein EP297_08325 [Gammaproteobacteria bacterium]|nr:MAG: hypothetical protein EP297_08325 [Gammaproteobacteria bacterium]
MKRRNEYDVTNRIKVTDYQQVRDCIREMYVTRYPRASFKPIHDAFEVFNQLFTGQYPGYHPCDTLYHDIQHSLDVTLGAARLIDGYDKSHKGKGSLGSQRAAMGIITALFHDAGYIRKLRDNKHVNGAEYTKIHVTRSGAFLKKIMPEIGMADCAETSSKIVHYSGYEISPMDIKVNDPKDKMVGYLMGTGDLMAQMSDRCYLEKCRDRLYPEFVLGGIDRSRDSDGREIVIYESALDLLYKTPSFYRINIRKRLEYYFDSAYIYAAAHFDGIDLYVKALEENITYLERLIAENNLGQLRRRPPKNIASKIFPFEGSH